MIRNHKQFLYHTSFNRFNELLKQAHMPKFHYRTIFILITPCLCYFNEPFSKTSKNFKLTTVHLAQLCQSILLLQILCRKHTTIFLHVTLPRNLRLGFDLI